MSKYTISTESKYNKDYQNSHYRAVILDDRGRRIRFGDNWFLSEEQASSEGQRLIEELEQRNRLAEFGIRITRCVFTDSDGSGKLMKYGLLIILLPTFLWMTLVFLLDSMTGFLNESGVLISLILPIGCMIFFAANQFNFGGNMVSYVLYDGNLYRIFIGNENTGTAQLVSKYLSTSMGAAILKKGEQDRQRDQQLPVHDSYLHTQLNKNDCWKILEVEDIVLKKGCYRIRCLIEKGRSRKKCRKSLYIRPGYNNYDQLIRCFEYLKECSKKK